jgi:hypothetical protein
MHVVMFSIHLDPLRFEVQTDPGKDFPETLDGITVEDFAAVFRHKDQMHVHLENAVTTLPNIVVMAHGLRVRSRYAATSSVQIQTQT